MFHSTNNCDCKCHALLNQTRQCNQQHIHHSNNGYMFSQVENYLAADKNSNINPFFINQLIHNTPTQFQPIIQFNNTYMNEVNISPLPSTITLVIDQILSPSIFNPFQPQQQSLTNHHNASNSSINPFTALTNQITATKTINIDNININYVPYILLCSQYRQKESQNRPIHPIRPIPSNCNASNHKKFISVENNINSQSHDKSKSLTHSTDTNNNKDELESFKHKRGRRRIDRSDCLNVDGRFQCKLCSKSYKRYNDLKGHVVVHKQTTKSCPYCKKKFSRPIYLRDHIRTHTGEKPFECYICQKRFNARRNLVQHRKRHFKEDTRIGS